MDPISQFVVQHLVGTATHLIIPLMLLAFIGGSITRVMLFYYARAEYSFAVEFEKRLRASLNDISENKAEKISSFQIFVTTILKKTFFECFELRTKFKRRNFDYVTSLTDRLLLIQNGCERVVEDTTRQIRYLKREHSSYERMTEITKNVFSSNPYFNRLIGIFPTGLLSELTNILPGLFIIAGIFGTFLGISHGLPELGAMDMSKPEEAKHIMDVFLISISQAMVKSIIGIFLSVTMSLINTFFSPEGLYYNAINRFSSTLDLAWNETENNETAILLVGTAEDPEQALDRRTA